MDPLKRPTDSSPYGGVLLAYRPLASLMKVYGIHPLQLQRERIDVLGPVDYTRVQLQRLSKCCCHQPGLWVSTIFNILLVLINLALATYVDVVGGEMQVETTRMSFWAICACALINFGACLIKGKLNSEVHLKWRLIDKRLGIAVDRDIQKWSQKMVVAFVGLKMLFFGTSAILVFTEREEVRDYTCFVLRIVVMILLVWHYCAILVPQMCYYFFSRAIENRFTILGSAVKSVLEHDRDGDDTIGQRDIAFELENLRHTYHLLGEVTQDISSLFSPMILLGFLIDSGMICTCMYRLLELWSLERWSVPLEVVAIVTSVLKILFTTILGSSVTSAAIETLKLLPKTCYRNKNRESQYQAQLFAMTLADDEPAFTASGFFGIDRKLFTATVSTVATYFVVLLQFRSTDQ